MMTPLMTPMVRVAKKSNLNESVKDASKSKVKRSNTRTSKPPVVKQPTVTVTKMTQLELPGVTTIAQHIRKNPIERVKLLDLDNGLELIEQLSNNKPVEALGYEFTKKSTRLRLFQNGHLFCCKCGVEGTHWYIERDLRNGHDRFGLQFYGKNKAGQEVMLTWDHIIPKSMGGNDSLSNAQTMCLACNAGKGNECDEQLIAHLDKLGRLQSMIHSNQDTYNHALARYMRVKTKKERCNAA